MKYRKASVISMILATALVVGATAAFAASDSDAPQTLREGQAVYTTASDSSVTSYVDPQDGKTYYSFDGGETFEPLTDEEFERRFPTPQVEWWTYEEYAAWLEKEKVELQAMLGEKGYTGGRGEFVWTQEVIDQTIAMYEEILQEIKAGKQYSKSVDGDTDALLISGDGESVAIFEEDGQLEMPDLALIHSATRVHPVTGDIAYKADREADQAQSSYVICFDTQAELDAHLKALDDNEAKGLDRYAGFEEMYEGIDPSAPMIYIVK